MAQSAKIMWWLTGVSIVVGVITLGFLWGTFREAKRTTKAATDTAKAAERAFYAQHRPKLSLRRARSTITDPEESTIVVRYTLTNIGDSECWMVNAHIGVQFVGEVGYPIVRLAPEEQFPDSVPYIGAIAPGESKDCIFIAPELRWAIENRKSYAYPLGYYFTGHITYLDQPGSDIKRQMAFRRLYILHQQAFRKSSEIPEEDEYAD